MRNHLSARVLLVLLPLLPSFSVRAQDTLRVDLRMADSLLVVRDLDLIAQHYEIDKADAARIQARLFNNPDLSTEWSIRPDRGAFFDAGPNGEKQVAIEELFRIAGQRGLAIKEAEARQRFSAAQYAELAGLLRMQLHSDLYQQFYLTRAVQAIASQLVLYKTVVDGYDEQVAKGNISQKEATRLRASYFDLSGQRLAVEQQLIDVQQELHILLGDDRVVAFQPAPSQIVMPLPLPADTGALVRASLQNRPQVQVAQADLDANTLELKLQHRSVVPDLSLGVVYDQNGSYLPNYTALTAGLSLPIFDRNQGRIKLAQAQLEQSRANLGSTQRNVREQVLRAYANIRLLQDQYASVSNGFDDQLDQLSESLIGNYLKSNISLLEFTDLFESYTSAIIHVNTLKADLQNAYEQLEFATGQRLFTR